MTDLILDPSTYFAPGQPNLRLVTGANYATLADPQPIDSVGVPDCWRIAGKPEVRPSGEDSSNFRLADNPGIIVGNPLTPNLGKGEDATIPH
jgi:hypothetical protein